MRELFAVALVVPIICFCTILGFLSVVEGYSHRADGLCRRPKTHLDQILPLYPLGCWLGETAHD